MKTPLYKRPYKAEQSLESYSCRCICGECGSATCGCSCAPSTNTHAGVSDNIRGHVSVRVGTQEHHAEVNWAR